MEVRTRPQLLRTRVKMYEIYIRTGRRQDAYVKRLEKLFAYYNVPRVIIRAKQHLARVARDVVAAFLSKHHSFAYVARKSFAVQIETIFSPAMKHVSSRVPMLEIELTPLPI